MAKAAGARSSLALALLAACAGSPRIAAAANQLAKFQVVVTPGTVSAGTPPTSVVVTAQDSGGLTVTNYSATNFLLSSTAQPSPSGQSPTLGTGVFQKGVATFHPVFYNVETVTITAQDTASAATGSATLVVTPAAAAALQFIAQPGETVEQVGIVPPVQVAIQDIYQNVEVSGAGATLPVTVSLDPSSPPGGVLHGTLTQNAVAGVATFNDLSITQPGASYVLDASSGSGASALSGAFSDPFPIDATPIPITITKISPNFGKLSGGNRVTISGTGFADLTSIQFGASTVAGTSTKVNRQGTSVVLFAPAAASSTPGTVHVQVLTSSGASDATTAASAYSYGPVIRSLSSPFGPAAGGNTLTINGANFAGITAISFGPYAADMSTVKVARGGTSLKVKVPQPNTGTPGAVHIVITGTGGSSDPASDASLYSFGPRIMKITPAYGSPNGGNKVVISAKNLGTSLSSLSVAFGSATVGSSSITFNAKMGTLAFNAPAQANGDPGVVNVTVTGPGGASGVLAASQYSYAPVVNSVSPRAGSSETTKVKISGKNFSGATQVNFADAVVPLTSGNVNLQGTLITVTAPDQNLGTFAVTVTSPVGTSPPTNAAVFTFK